MGFNKWTLEVCTGYSSDENSTFEAIYSLLDQNSATPYYQARFRPLRREEARKTFGISDEHLNHYYTDCTYCGQELPDQGVIYPDTAMEAQFNLWNIRVANFAYCSEMCRLLHLFEHYQQKEAPKYAHAPETAKEAP
jgi:hypothetical protein